MEVISINKKRTKSRADITFNIDNAPLEEVVRKLKYGTLHVRLENGCLRISGAKDDISIKAHVVKEICDRINTLEKEIDEEQARELAKREQMLSDISRITELPLDE